MTRAQYEAAKKVLSTFGHVTEFTYDDGPSAAIAVVRLYSGHAKAVLLAERAMRLAQTTDATLRAHSTLPREWMIELSITLPREARDAA